MDDTAFALPLPRNLSRDKTRPTTHLPERPPSSISPPLVSPNSPSNRVDFAMQNNLACPQSPRDQIEVAETPLGGVAPHAPEQPSAAIECKISSPRVAPLAQYPDPSAASPAQLDVVAESSDSSETRLTPSNLSGVSTPLETSDGYDLSAFGADSIKFSATEDKYKVLSPPSSCGGGSDDDHEHTTLVNTAATSPIPPLPSSSPPLSTSDDEEDKGRLDRIRTAIVYTRDQLSTGLEPAVQSNFTIERTNPPSAALILLRRAHHNSLAYKIYESDKSVCYSLGVPPAGLMFGAVSPQWWTGKSRAQVKAGVFANEADVKKAEVEVNKAEKRRQKSEKSGRLKIERKILEEGLRRRNAGLRMWDEAGDKGGKQSKGRKSRKLMKQQQHMGVEGPYGGSDEEEIAVWWGEHGRGKGPGWIEAGRQIQRRQEMDAQHSEESSTRLVWL
ncbi:hypothetical protein K505DRAFT_332812 [Melanomma pulvis-pyrius CBS 109.77]|uniref:Uncharacterized protein n=1 Tax=Melanomma pulvis-pyrius CBS 109.77 TaxID=1314802 RepID=A0A6A6XRT2_9PLEO|nr:hypothetical protein K505DRAFT_332812 [Melanomma pulvis-pyrius CBS 109.77]